MFLTDFRKEFYEVVVSQVRGLEPLGGQEEEEEAEEHGACHPSPPPQWVYPIWLLCKQTLLRGRAEGKERNGVGPGQKKLRVFPFNAERAGVAAGEDGRCSPAWVL